MSDERAPVTSAGHADGEGGKDGKSSVPRPPAPGPAGTAGAVPDCTADGGVPASGSGVG
jgi:hypothetical protein